MKKTLYFLIATIILAGCVNLDIPPKNIVSDDALLDKLKQYAEQMKEAVAAKDANLQDEMNRG